jgi:hypothetical protein
MTQLALIEALVDDLHKAVQEYGDAIPLAAAIGSLEIVKFELIASAQEEEE